MFRNSLLVVDLKCIDNYLVEKAFNIAFSAHRNQFDKAGVPYINHPVSVANMLTDINEKVVALLHDVVEDTDITLDYLKSQGFDDSIISAVDAISKRDNESLSDYLYRVKSNSLARNVKIADLTHNSDISRIKTPKEKDFLRCKRYAKEIEYLRSDDKFINL